MTCQVYKDSAESAKQALIHALNENESLNTVNDLYDHYKGLRKIADTHTHNDTITFDTSPDYYTNSSYPVGVEMGEAISLGLGTEDTITFADADGVMNIDYPTQGFGINDDISFTTSDDVVTVPEDTNVERT